MSSSSQEPRTVLSEPCDTQSESDSSSVNLDPADDAGWEDIEPDDDSQPVVGLFSTAIYPDVCSMLRETKDKHNFDLIKVKKELGV
jgi:type I protein arginine methyltransferase